MRSRIHDNPVLGIRTEFTELFEETKGTRTTAEVTIQPGTTIPLHVHHEVSEYYEVLEGELKIEAGKEIKTLHKGDYLLVPAKVVHRYFNETNETARFKVVVQPGNFGFQLMVCVLNGLARDGKVNKRGLPKSLLVFGYLSVAAGSNIPGFMSFIQPVLNWLHDVAVDRGIDKQLIANYYL